MKLNEMANFERVFFPWIRSLNGLFNASYILTIAKQDQNLLRCNIFMPGQVVEIINLEFDSEDVRDRNYEAFRPKFEHNSLWLQDSLGILINVSLFSTASRIDGSIIRFEGLTTEQGHYEFLFDGDFSNDNNVPVNDGTWSRLQRWPFQWFEEEGILMNSSLEGSRILNPTDVLPIIDNESSPSVNDVQFLPNNLFRIHERFNFRVNGMRDINSRESRIGRLVDA